MGAAHACTACHDMPDEPLFFSFVCCGWQGDAAWRTRQGCEGTLRLFGLGAGGHNRGVDCREAVHSLGHKSGTRPNECNVDALLLLGGVLGFSSASGQRPIRLGPAPVCVCACARRCAWFFFCVWPASQQVGASASLCVCSVVLSFAPRLFQLFRLLPTLSGSSLPCSGMVERACLVARALVLTSDGSSAPATGLLGVGSQPMWR